MEGASTLIYLVIGYICGVVFAPDVVSANFMATNWYNIWTYAWIFGWPVMLVLHFVGILVAAGPAVVVMEPAVVSPPPAQP